MIGCASLILISIHSYSKCLSGLILSELIDHRKIMLFQRVDDRLAHLLLTNEIFHLTLLFLFSQLKLATHLLHRVPDYTILNEIVLFLSHYYNYIINLMKLSLYRSLLVLLCLFTFLTSVRPVSDGDEPLTPKFDQRVGPVCQPKNDTLC